MFKARNALHSTGQNPANFWMDTLCVSLGDDITLPSGNAERAEVVKPKDLRRAVLRQMSEIYRGADRVLVLDTELVGRYFNSSEKLMRVATSGWLRRLWTLQEACLAGTSLFFQFEDGALPILDVLSYKIKNVDRHGLYNWCDAAAARSLSSLVVTAQMVKASPGHSMKFVDRQEVFESLFELLSLRSTSKIEDEALCVSTILGIDVTEIYDIKEAPRRMGKIFEKLGDMDAQILFTSGPRMEEEGFRWAPKSLLARPNGHDTRFSGGGQISKGVFATQRRHGLFVKLPYWLITTPPVDVSDGETSEEEEEESDKETSDEEGGPSGEEAWPLACFRLGEEEEEPYALYALTECTKSTLDEDNGRLPDVNLLLADDVELAVLWLDPTDAYSNEDRTLMGVLVSIDREIEEEEEEEEAWLVHYICRVEGTRADGRSNVDDNDNDDWYTGLKYGYTGRATTSLGIMLWCVD